MDINQGRTPFLCHFRNISQFNRCLEYSISCLWGKLFLTRHIIFAHIKAVGHFLVFITAFQKMIRRKSESV